ncbi:hypothetical protein C5L28_002602 [Lentilactobacillus parakefiri]|uniref:Membrane protein n=1 Tax=Lentilactobacillus parakefiri TaxID=152332 RepID=A0A224VKZ3_9LACO|nr:YibE/F family protein [Lentilactobacillus parakefiri]PAL00215.1 hypothetical protein B8W96_07710 [Lentilactobacillus parakefiri]TDG95082.1 hypothetical protein C5L28_002602 [Lentilactobacillus parakefiri]GAW73211.1 membrane protein [Lentilactobacillus parakefiri]
MGSITLMWLILGAIIIAVNGVDGIKSFASLAINFAIILLMIRLISMGFSFILVVGVCTLVILWSTIYFGVSNLDVADIAFIGSLIVIAIVGCSFLEFFRWPRFKDLAKKTPLNWKTCHFMLALIIKAFLSP